MHDMVSHLHALDQNMDYNLVTENDLYTRDIRILKMLSRRAIDISPIRSGKIASAVVIRNDIISLGENSLKSHPFQFKYGRNPESIFLHSEVDAIRSSLNHISVEDFHRATLYISRVKRISSQNKKDWVPGNACPCDGCATAIIAFGIKRVVFTTDTMGSYGEWYR